jgi:hypothetical protein
VKSFGRRTAACLLAGVAAITAVLFIAAAIPGGHVLSVTPVKGGKPLATIWLQPGEHFTIRYYHSVENAPIWETHSVGRDGRIYIEEERYLKFGAGMGKMPGVGRMEQRGPYEVITDMHMPTGNFVLRIGSVGVDHTLIWRGREKNLSALAPHTAVRFTARPVSWLNGIGYLLNGHWDQDHDHTPVGRS